MSQDNRSPEDLKKFVGAFGIFIEREVRPVDTLRVMADDLPHSSLYLGAYEEQAQRDVDPPAVPGIVFGFLESKKKALDAYLWVRIDEIGLRAPVLVIPGRHTGFNGDNRGKEFGPKETRLGDEQATAIIVDAIVANPECRDALGRKLQGLGRA